MKKKIMLCADDYAQSEAISAGILQAAKALRINAVSCLASAPDWSKAGSALQSIPSTCLVGLHFNLTWGCALSSFWQTHYDRHFANLSTVIMQCYLGQMHAETVLAEMRMQLDAFRQVMGRNPDFIDGHQHVHQFPVIRDALCLLYTQEQLNGFVRVTGAAGWQGFPKAQVIALLGSKTLRRMLNNAAIPINTSFSGVYPFKHAPRYADYFKQFLSSSESGGLIMCHPGTQSHERADPLHASRYHELSYLMSDAFLHDLDAHGFELQVKS